MSDIYTRDYGGGRRASTGYNPPPGYMGTAFDSGSMKMHEADVDISTLHRERYAEAEETSETIELQKPPVHPIERERVDDAARRDSRKLEDLIRSLRGKFGTEELILILILLVVSSDGIGIEALVLGLLLMVK